jgi:hypothetical protein
MPQPRLIKVHRTFTDKNCSSSDVVSITFVYFLNPPYLSLKYSIQFFLIDTPQNRLQGVKTLVFVSHPSPFEFFFHCRKHAEITRGYTGRIKWLWDAAHVMFFGPIS